MKKIHILSLASSLMWAVAAQAQVHISDVWVRGTVPSQQASGAFMRIQADEEVRLLSASSPVAAVTEVHEMLMEGDIMRMREVAAGLPIAKGSTLQLEPGGYHIMLMALKQPLTAEQTVPITLTFQGADGKAFTRQIEAPVRPLGTAPGHQGHQGHGPKPHQH